MQKGALIEFRSPVRDARWMRWMRWMGWMLSGVGGGAAPGSFERDKNGRRGTTLPGGSLFFKPIDRRSRIADAFEGRLQKAKFKQSAGRLLRKKIFR